MSHSLAEIIHGGKVVGYSEYNGTVDVMAHNSWYGSIEEVSAHWREHKRVEVCSCVPVPIEIYSDYGNGFYWPATACLTHRVIHDGLIPGEEENAPMSKGHPLGLPKMSQR